MLCLLFLLLCRWHSAYSGLQIELTDLKKSHAGLKAENSELETEFGDSYTSLWTNYLSMHMLACDTIFPRPRFTKSPHTRKAINMSHVKIVQHRLFNLMDSDEDGIISEEDVNAWMDTHIRVGTIERVDVVRRKFEGKYAKAKFPGQEDWQLCKFVVEKV